MSTPHHEANNQEGQRLFVVGCCEERGIMVQSRQQTNVLCSFVLFIPMETSLHGVDCGGIGDDCGGGLDDSISWFLDGQLSLC